jgi:hypothetical protein
MKSTLFVLATLAVSGFAASLRQEAPKFLSQQADAAAPATPTVTAFSPEFYASQTAQTGDVIEEITSHAPGVFTGSWIDPVLAAKDVHGSQSYGLLMNMNKPRVAAN